jgi:MFS family permease
MSAEETLAWEAEHRSRAAIAAFAAAFLTILGVLLTTVGQPSSSQFDDRILTVVDTMGKTARGETVPPGRLSAYTVEVGQSPALPIVGAVLFGLGSLAIYFAMAYLFRATRARKPEFQQIALIMAAIGAVGFGLGRAISEIARYLGAHDFVDAADKTNSAASDALSPPATLIGQVIWQAAALALGFAFVLIALNAMRVGLLTRFMGVLGIIVGVTFVLPLDQQGIIRVFWLAALGMLFLGRMPSGLPKAWTTGEAEPWPSQQQLREQREAARAEAASERVEEAPEKRASPTERTPAKAPPPAPPTPRRPDAAAAGTPHAASKKRKRKRRSP